MQFKMQPQQQKLEASDLFLQSKLFNEALSKQTSHYIQSKMLSLPKDAQDLKKLDLRDMCEKVVMELEIVEKQAAYDYIQVSEQLETLGNELTVTDQIMEELENVLYNFKDHLQTIKSEMTTLQQKSNKMNNSLSNRKKLQSMLSSFIDSAVLDKELIDAICLAEINENYVGHVKALLKKLSYLNNNLISPDSKAVEQLKPELEKLKARASVRLKEFLLEQIKGLKKPKSNIQIIQNNVLIKYKVFTEFFKDHYPSIFTDLCNSYRETMAGVYVSNYKTYLAEIHKLQVELYAKTDTILPADAQFLRSFLPQTKPTNLNQDKKSIFSLMGREKIVHSTDSNDVILYNVSNQKGQKFTMEQIFKSINKVLMDGVLGEVVFTAEFFNVKSEGAIQIFGPLFRPILNIFLEHLKNTVSQSYDIFGCLLILAINEWNKQTFHEKQLKALDYYFDQVNMTVWPRFEALFEEHMKGIVGSNTKSYRMMEKTATGKVLVDRFADFMISMYKLSAYFPNSKMVGPRVQALRKTYFDLIKKVRDQHDKEVDGMSYYLNVLEIYRNNQSGETNVKAKEFYDDQQKVEKEIAAYADRIVIKYIGEFFPSLDSLTKKHLKEDGTFSIQGHVDQKTVDVIISDLSTQNLNGKLQKLIVYCEKIYSGYSLKALLKNFMNIFINYYTEFYKYVKNTYPDSAAMMLQSHNMMKEFKTALAKYL